MKKSLLFVLGTLFVSSFCPAAEQVMAKYLVTEGVFKKTLTISYEQQTLPLLAVRLTDSGNNQLISGLCKANPTATNKSSLDCLAPTLKGPHNFEIQFQGSLKEGTVVIDGEKFQYQRLE